jgi:hypothetical protein
MRRRHVLLLPLLTTGLAATLAVALLARTSLATPPTEFRTPDAGAACKLEQEALVCSSLESPGAVVLRAVGSPTVVHRLPWWDASTPVLRTWRHGAISCRLDENTIVCHTARAAVLVSGGGFTVAA